MNGFSKGEGGALDAIIVGAGFAGLYSLHLLRSRGWRAKIFEAAEDVGGTWYWNRYPGARCDVQSLVYCYTFDDALQRQWTWSERYATQPEILRYLNFVADQLNLRGDVTFKSPISEASFDDRRCLWTVTTRDGRKATARYLIMATGALSVGRIPDLPGIEDFGGDYYHTGSWPSEGVDFAGKRVAVIGTGSSGVQAIPLIAEEARHLTVFQRTPGYVAPARNRTLMTDEIDRFRGDFETYKERLKRGDIVGNGDVMLIDHLPPKKPSTFAVSPEERQKLMEDRWQVGNMIVAHAFADALTDDHANAVLADFFRAKVREIVTDPKMAGILSSMDYPIGAKRVCVGTDYYETFNRTNVSLVDLRSTPIEAITKAGIQTTTRLHEVDIIVFATGYDALTGALTSIDIRGANGTILRETWSDGPTSYLGLAVSGYPNLFTVTGPGSPSVLGNVVVSIEQHVEWIADILDHARAVGARRIEAELDAQQKWSNHVAEVAAGTIFSKGQSWYVGANIPGKPRVFLAYLRGIAPYRDLCDQIAEDDYQGFSFSDCPVVHREGAMR
jgi:cyclohexanone monooxygenase